MTEQELIDEIRWYFQIPKDAQIKQPENDHLAGGAMLLYRALVFLESNRMAMEIVKNSMAECRIPIDGKHWIATFSNEDAEIINGASRALIAKHGNKEQQ